MHRTTCPNGGWTGDIGPVATREFACACATLLPGVEERLDALLQADLDEGEGAFIAPMWLRAVPALAAADITQDWSEDLSGICGEEVEAFYAWLTRQGRPSNVVDFFAERDKRRGSPASDPDAES